MRALLVVNTSASSTTGKVRDILARALASALDVQVVHTTHRGHATELGAGAVRDGLELVVALGGDGTVNEVVNGLLVDGPGPRVPDFAVVPGGSTNVFSRALGQARDPVEATAEILAGLRSGLRRRVSLGRADQRWFTFTAGFGFDADVVQRVEQLRADGAVSTAGLYARAGVGRFVTGGEHRHPVIDLAVDDEAADPGYFLCIATNTSPWTYIGRHPVRLLPDTSFDRGLDLLAMRRLSTAQMLGHVTRAVRGRPPRPHPTLRIVQDAHRVRLSAPRPLGLQVDGDFVGRQDAVVLHCVPRALTVVADPAV